MKSTWILLVMIQTLSATKVYPKEDWFKSAQDKIENIVNTQPNTNVAKNLVMVIGDGMGVSTTTAARIYRGQKTPGVVGEEAELSWDKFPHAGFSKTYTTDTMTADSAGTATAYHTGAKTKNGVIGLDDNVQRRNCSTTESANSLTSIAQWARNEGKSVGIVTTDMLSGGSPSPLYAKAADRDWKDDSELPSDAQNCRDISIQLLDDENLDIQVLLGGGRVSMLGNDTTDPEYPSKRGNRLDGRNIAEEWKAMQLAKGRKAQYVYNQAGFDAAYPATTDYLMGVFEPERMQRDYLRRNQTPPNEPSLAEMTERAINILSKNQKGFYLFVEGAAIDKGHHTNKAHEALDETLALDDAVNKILELTSTDDTLVVVSADHSHVFTFGGYAERGTNILGLVKNAKEPKRERDELNNTFSIIAYGNGPGYYSQREGLTQDLFDDNSSALYITPVPMNTETHGGEDVAIYASGPMSHLFTGTQEQSYIPHAMAYAACIGSNKKHCDSKPDNQPINKAGQLQATLVLATTLSHILTILIE